VVQDEIEMARLVGKLGRLKSIGWVCLGFSTIGEPIPRDIRGTLVGQDEGSYIALCLCAVGFLCCRSLAGVGWRWLRELCLDHGRRPVQPAERPAPSCIITGWWHQLVCLGRRSTWPSCVDLAV